MCGIVGAYYFKSGTRASAESLKAMTDKIIHYMRTNRVDSLCDSFKMKQNKLF